MQKKLLSFALALVVILGCIPNLTVQASTKYFYGCLWGNETEGMTEEAEPLFWMFGEGNLDGEVDQPIGFTTKDGYKYVMEYKDKYTSVSMDDEGDFIFGKATSSLKDAVKDSDKVDKDIQLWLPCNPTKCKTASAYKKVAKNIYILVYDGDKQVDRFSIKDIEKYCNEDDSSNSDSDSSKDFIDANVMQIGVDYDTREAKIKVDWVVNHEYVGCDDFQGCIYFMKDGATYGIVDLHDYGTSSEGSATFTCDLSEGEYEYLLTSALYEEIGEEAGVTTKGTIKIDLSDLDDTEDPEKDPSAENESTEKAVITFSKSAEKLTKGEVLKVTAKSTLPVIINLNGNVSGNDYKDTAEFSITENGTYTYTAATESGVLTTGTLDIDCFVDEKYVDYNREALIGGSATGSSNNESNPSDFVSKLAQTGREFGVILVILTIACGVLVYFVIKKKGGFKHGKEA